MQQNKQQFLERRNKSSSSIIEHKNVVNAYENESRILRLKRKSQMIGQAA
jgi:hypothetical protein